MHFPGAVGSVATTLQVCQVEQAWSLPSGLQIHWELKGLYLQMTSSYDPAGSAGHAAF